MNPIKKFFSVSLVVALFFLSIVYFPETAYACSCVAGISQEESFEKAKAVFSGTVISVSLEKNPIQEILGSGETFKKVQIAVSESWKGVVADTVTVGTAEYGAACGYDFEVGGEYLVYAHDGGRRFDSDLAAGLCGRTLVLSSDQAQSDLEILGAGKMLPNDPRIPIDNNTGERNNSFLFETITILVTELQKFLNWLLAH